LINVILGHCLLYSEKLAKNLNKITFLSSQEQDVFY